VAVDAAESDAQRPPPTVTPVEASDCKMMPRLENGKRGGGSLERDFYSAEWHPDSISEEPCK